MCTVSVPPGTGLGNTALDHLTHYLLFIVWRGLDVHSSSAVSLSLKVIVCVFVLHAFT